MTKKAISTPDAPGAIGTYSQAVRAGDTVYLSGQIPLDPKTMQIVEGFENQVKRVFENLRAVCRAAGGDFDRVVRVTIYLTDLAKFSVVNDLMAWAEPFVVHGAHLISESELAEAGGRFRKRVEALEAT